MSSGVGRSNFDPPNAAGGNQKRGKNRLVVMINWAWSYVTYRRGARLITGYAAPDAGQALRLQRKSRIETDGLQEVDPGHEVVAARTGH